MKIFGVLSLFHSAKVYMPIISHAVLFLSALYHGLSAMTSKKKVQVGCCCIASSDSSVLHVTCSFSWCDMLV